MAPSATQPATSALTIVIMIANFFILYQAVRTISIGTDYAVWTGIGALGTAILGVILFSEPVSGPPAASILLIVVDIAGLKLTVG